MNTLSYIFFTSFIVITLVFKTCILIRLLLLFVYGTCVLEPLIKYIL